MKYLIWFIIVLAVVTWFKRTFARLTSSPDATRGRGPTQSQPEAMRQCQHCGTYIPASEAVSGSSGAIFCSEEHKALHASRK
jgi:uncharacterized protein